MPRPPAPASIRVGLREIAAAAGVSVMTVSLALRGNPRISIATRDRIKRLADELGYHPDPELSRLMNHLRTSRTARGKIGVALVDFYPRLLIEAEAKNQTVLEIADLDHISLLGFIENGHTIDLESDGFNEKYELEGSAKIIQRIRNCFADLLISTQN